MFQGVGRGSPSAKRLSGLDFLGDYMFGRKNKVGASNRSLEMEL